LFKEGDNLMMRIATMVTALIGLNNAPEDLVEPPQPPVMAPTVNKDTTKVTNQSSTINTKEAINTKSEFGTLPPIKQEQGPDTYELPSIEIEGSDVIVPLGDIVELSISPVEKLPSGLKSSIYSWTILPPPPKVIPWVDNTKVFFGTGIKDQEYTVILTGTYAFSGDSKTIEHRTSTIIKKVTVGSGVVTQTKPAAKLDNLNGLAKSITESLSLVGQYDTEQKKTDFKNLAESFRKVASIAESKPELMVRTIITTQVEANAEVLGDRVTFYTKLYDYVGVQFDAISPGQQVGKTDMAKIYRIIASVLDDNY
jgi:hypothetical protein